MGTLGPAPDGRRMVSNARELARWSRVDARARERERGRVRAEGREIEIEIVGVLDRSTDPSRARARARQNLIFRFLQTKARVQIWMYENTDACVEGRIVGFDEYMNLVLDDAEEVVEKKQRRVSVGRILLKGDNITLMRNVTQKEK
jgi:small nuclear ribonucleoprotein E